jgi:hypothetical protein
MPPSPSHPVSRYNLTIVFEEIYTRDPAQLEISANAIGEIIGTIQQALLADTALQAKLAAQHLSIQMIAPERVAPQRVIAQIQEA